jgi:hypothetical protein
VLYDLQYPASIVDDTRRILSTLWNITFHVSILSFPSYNISNERYPSI